MAVIRYRGNPIIRCEDVEPILDGGQIIGVFNAAVARVGGQTVLLVRVAERPEQVDASRVITAFYDSQTDRIVLKSFDRSDAQWDFTDPRLIAGTDTIYLTSLSTLRVARSTDGVHFRIDPDVCLQPANAYESYGLEDPRISFLDGRYWIDAVAVSSQGVVTELLSTEDFIQFERHGLIFGPENKDVALFTERINGSAWALHRPSSPFSTKNSIWLASSPDFMHWGDHHYLIGPRPGYWDNTRIGAGAPPVRIEKGWLEIYHGVDQDDRYCLGAVLLDRDRPWRVLARSETPILEPQASYETEGFYGQVVFTCGVLLNGSTCRIYYGAADEVMAMADVALDDILSTLRRN